MSFRAKQSLGQNFLVDENMARKIVDCIDPRPDDIMLEIGPGQGVLTRLLQPRVNRLVTVEIDQRFYDLLETRFQQADNFELVKNDFLKVDLNEFGSDRMRVVGNIPYNITSPILFKIFAQRQLVKDLTLLVQKQVGNRVVAKAGCKEYGILAVFSQAFADVDMLLHVPPTVFQPRPKIDSALIRWIFTNERAKKIKDEAFFRAIVKQAFGMRRKMLRNSLKEYALMTSYDFTRRPEQLRVDEWIDLANELIWTQSIEKK
ncbi:ribosomal RNA small subunit methyltransferase A [candidate division KSB1 bacterium]|nr:ribosomal RNA small subunit methyltransferase A [candidate division KSB1 bacterium]RQW08952.1 MAG: ribosomal RNA small subunit methyltransferase A [candidate division KSB1 bacterium]